MKAGTLMSACVIGSLVSFTVAAFLIHLIAGLIVLSLVLFLLAAAARETMKDQEAEKAKKEAGPHA